MTDAYEQEAAFSATDRDLANQLIKALRVKLFTNWADSSFAGLTLLKFFIKLVLAVYDIRLGRRSGKYITDPELSVFCVLARRQNRVEIILISG